ncbi:hypothetical protein Dimus_004428 [Dionaea muscipula]
MDWFSWLSKTGLKPSLVYEYGSVFAQNELEQEDIPYLNHEFLQTMGISIAKHRLEILKLAKRDISRAGGGINPMSKLIVVIKRTRKSLAKRIGSWVRREDQDQDQDQDQDRSALVVVPKVSSASRTHSSRWKRSMVMKMKQKNKSSCLLVNEEKKLMLTNGGGGHDSSLVVSSPSLESFSSPLIYDMKRSFKGKDQYHDGYNWTPALEEVRWDTMFQDLNPT